MQGFFISLPIKARQVKSGQYHQYPRLYKQAEGLFVFQESYAGFIQLNPETNPRIRLSQSSNREAAFLV